MRPLSLSLAYAVAELADPPSPNTAEMPTTKIPFRKGGEMKRQYKVENFRAVYRDEYTAEPLPNELVHKAMCEELEDANNIVWGWWRGRTRRQRRILR